MFLDNYQNEIVILPPSDVHPITTLSFTSFRWKRHIPESAEQLCARVHVLLLHDGRHGTRVRQVPVVEEIHDRAADRKYYDWERGGAH